MNLLTNVESLSRAWDAAARSKPRRRFELEIGIAIQRPKAGPFLWNFVTPNNGILKTSRTLELPLPPGVAVRFRLNTYPEGTEAKGNLFDPEREVTADSTRLKGYVHDPSTGVTHTVYVVPKPAHVLEVVIHNALSPTAMTFREKAAPLGLYIAQLDFQENSPRLQSFYLLPETSVQLTFDEPDDVMYEFSDTPVTFEVEPQPDWLQVTLPADKKSLILRNNGDSWIESAVPAVIQAASFLQGDPQRKPIRIDPTVVNRGSMTDMAEPPTRGVGLAEP